VCAGPTNTRTYKNKLFYFIQRDIPNREGGSQTAGKQKLLPTLKIALTFKSSFSHSELYNNLALLTVTT